MKTTVNVAPQETIYEISARGYLALAYDEGKPVELRLRCGDVLTGTVSLGPEIGDTWVDIDTGTQHWAVRLSDITAIGLVTRDVPALTRIA